MLLYDNPIHSVFCSVRKRDRFPCLAVASQETVPSYRCVPPQPRDNPLPPRPRYRRQRFASASKNHQLSPPISFRVDQSLAARQVRAVVSVAGLNRLARLIANPLIVAVIDRRDQEAGIADAQSCAIRRGNRNQCHRRPTRAGPRRNREPHEKSLQQRRMFPSAPTFSGIRRPQCISPHTRRRLLQLLFPTR